MAKTYYADYVNHILRFYFRYDRNKGFKNDVDKTNYMSADRVIQKLSDTEIKVLTVVYQQDNTNIVDNVMMASKCFREDPVKIWSLISTTTTKIAKERKLL